MLIHGRWVTAVGCSHGLVGIGERKDSGDEMKQIIWSVYFWENLF